ncbi:carbon monoxide dehydrogenase [Anaerovorax odorimutans]|uniref:Carbon monoxide dehydrogenase n=1 Tax=Anaerovorax odorimutans TaxID=109327 RepID=A0ABT1RIW9_9FIRM|nr:carbon monoxide dehydrogenase [Anaerovorax odorimutans]MCQ4635125.1 carbon monoxide dehydrogenase [Anaerovorax odorimutans]
MADKQIICPDADQVLGQFIEGLDVETSHHRMIQQENKCGYGLSGVCCRLCSNGPCRISPARPKGVCGADADTIAVRNFLRSVAAGSGCYIHVVENAARQLKKAAKDRVPLKGIPALDRLCRLLGVSGFSDWDKASKVSDAVLADLRRPVDEKMELVEKVAYPLRTEAWKKTGLMPGGAKDEIFNALVKTSTNLNSDPVDMLLQCLRLGISTGVYGLVLTNLINDVLMGEGEIGFEPVGLRVVDPDCVNIMITGHQHAFFGDLQEYLSSEEVKSLAAAQGAKGVKIVGCTCVGQDFQLRKAAGSDAFCGHAGNNYTSEAVLATGCIDLVLSEFNCTIPGIEPICEELGIPQICLDDVAKKANAEYMSYSYEDRQQISRAVAEKALESFGRRKISMPGDVQKLFVQLSDALGKMAAGSQEARALESVLAEAAAKQDWGTRKNPLAAHGYGNAITGVTEVTLKKFLGGSYGPLIDLIKAGKIKGIAGVVGCSNLRAKGHDVFTVELTKELIKKDILVLSAGCTCGGLENCGLMSPEAAALAGDNLREVCESLEIPPVLNFGPCLAIGRMELVAGEIAKDLGIDIPQLPIVISAPQWLEEQALADGAFALALGFTVHLGLAPFVTGSLVALSVLTEKMPEITGGRLMVDTDVSSSAEALEAVILEKRQSLGL